MLHPGTELKFVNAEIGYGIFAKTFIPEGTITWALDELDRKFKPQEVRAMARIYRELIDTYTFRNNQGDYVLCWDNGKFMNHSFRANTISTAYDFEIAVKDINVGDQITNDYGYLNIEEPFRGIDEGTRRKIVYPDDLKKYYKMWDKKLKMVFPKIPDIDQPLKVLIPDQIWEEIVDISMGNRQMRSVLYNFYQGENNNIK